MWNNFSKKKNNWRCTWEAGVHMQHLSHSESVAANQTVTHELSPAEEQRHVDSLISTQEKFKKKRT